MILHHALFTALLICLSGTVLQAGIPDPKFRKQQNNYPRVQKARQEKQTAVMAAFKNRGISFPPNEIFIRIFKQERTVELWAHDTSGAAPVFHKIKDYPMTSFSGTLGPKRQEGDGQIPEGFYHIDRFNPASAFYLSLGLNYPNQSDRILSDRRRPGGDIFIHGSSVTIGCVPIGDDAIKELYLVAVEARANGQDKIPVHIFPGKMTTAYFNRVLDPAAAGNRVLEIFWQNLRLGFDRFEQNKQLFRFTVNSRGTYIVE